MKKILKRVAIIVGALLSLALISLAVIWIWGGQILNRNYVPEDRGFTLENANIDVVEGERLARIFGCMGACHGDQMEGKVLFEAPMFARVVPPNLTRAVAKYSDGELEAMIRQGITPDGRGLIIMPATNYSALRDEDLRNIIAFMRQAPVLENDPGLTTVSIIARFLFVMGEFKLQPEMEMSPVTPERLAGEVTIDGGYLTGIFCSECHGSDLKGGNDEESPAPNLVLAKAYSEEEFITLMRTGFARGDQELELMAEMARTHFVHLRDDEIKDLYGFLQDRSFD